MFVSIDMDKLVFLHAHHDGDVLRDLAWLEAPDRSVRVENTETPIFLEGMSKLDVVLLGKNTINRDLSHKWDFPPPNDVLRRIMRKVALRLKPTLALADEVRAQVEAVCHDLDKGVPYKYALGARTPAAPQELFPLVIAPDDVFPDEAVAKAAKVPLPQGDYVPPPPVATTPARAPSAPDKPRDGRANGVRAVVHAGADEAMAAAGTAAFLADWPAQRALLITRFEGEGYHPTTVRIKLSEWAKAHGI